MANPFSHYSSPLHPISDWPNTSADDRQLATWLNKFGSQSGVSLLTDRFPTIDIDIPGKQKKTKVKQAIKICEEELGVKADYIKIGQFPKVSIICRSEASFGKKLKTAVYRDPLDTKDIKLAVEILGTGQHTVLLNIHPLTGKRYRWIRKRITDPVFNIDMLPILTYEKGKRILERMETEVFSDLVPKNGRTMDTLGLTPGVVNNPFENYKPPCNFSIDQILMDLEVVSPDSSYDDWVTVGMALHHQFSGSDDGLNLFNEWSAKGVKYTPESTTDSPQAKWASFKDDLSRKPVVFLS